MLQNSAILDPIHPSVIGFTSATEAATSPQVMIATPSGVAILKGITEIKQAYDFIGESIKSFERIQDDLK